MSVRILCTNLQHTSLGSMWPPPTRDADKRVSDARGPTRSARACLEDTVSVLILPSPTSLTPEISSAMSIPEVSRTHSVDNLKND